MRLLQRDAVGQRPKVGVAEQPHLVIAALGRDRRGQDRPQRLRLEALDAAPACGDRRASRSFILPTEPFRVAIMSERNSGLSA